MQLGRAVEGLTGERRGNARSGGLELADYRPYTPGDDLRRVDWNVYARLHEAVVKTTDSEAHLSVSLLIDGSASMDGGEPAKFRHAQRLAAALGAIALLRSDSAEAHLLADGASWAGGPLSGPRSVGTLLEELGSLRRGRRTDLAASVRAYRSARRGAEQIILISDALVEPDNLRAALEELARSAAAATLIHVTATDVDRGGVGGPVELRDRETGENLVLELDSAALRRHFELLEQLAARARSLAAQAGVGYLRAPVEEAPLDLLLGTASRQRLLRFDG